MNSDAKYIVWDDPMCGYTMILFPPTLTHADVAQRLGIINDIWSAGFANCEAGYCYGESISLKKKYDPKTDDHLLSRLIGRKAD